MSSTPTPEARNNLDKNEQNTHKVVLPPFWESPETVSCNRLPARATFYRFQSIEQALKGDREQSDRFTSLNGSWQFRLLNSPEEVMQEHLIDCPNEREEASVHVPGNWTMQGYDKPHYTNITMPFSAEPPKVPENNPTGVYKRPITIPSSWEGSRIVVHFGGAESVLVVFVDGQLIGMGKDSRLPSEFDLSPYVRAGETHTLSAVVIKWSDATYLEDQDQWWMGGLHREVFLYATHQTYLEDVFLKAGLDDTYTCGMLELDARIASVERIQGEWAMHLYLFDEKGQSLSETPRVASFNTAAPGPFVIGRNQAALNISLDKPALWSAEQPMRYTAVIALVDEQKVAREYIQIVFGFRNIEVRDRMLLINGEPVLINGVNRHDHHDTLGKAVDRESMRQDVQLMKAYNVNAVRCAHYPNDPYWLDLCDEYGLYVIDEANLETHAHHHDFSNASHWSQAFLDRAVRMVERDKNHPSIILWSLGNETALGTNHEAMAAWIRSKDPTRPLHFEPGIWIQGKTQQEQPFSYRYDMGYTVTDIVSPMYASPDELREWLVEGHPDQTRPLIMCEYSHAMGNSNGGLADYYAMFHSEHGLQGGFIWEWIDHGLKQVDASGTTYWAYGGDFGDKPNDANFVCDGLIGPDRSPHPALMEFKKLAQPIAVKFHEEEQQIEVFNRNHFVALENLDLCLKQYSEGELIAVSLKKCPVIPPRERQKLSLKDLMESSQAPWDTLVVIFVTNQDNRWSKKGHVIAWENIEQNSYTEQEAPSPEGIAAVYFQPSSKAQSFSTQTLTAGNLSLSIDPDYGVVACTMKGRPVFRQPPEPNLWRAPIDNDGIKLWSGQEGKPLGRWTSMGLNQLQHSLLKSYKDETVSGETLYCWEFASSGRKDPSDLHWGYAFCLHENDTFSLDIYFRLGDRIQDPPRVGILMHLLPGFENLRWRGLGPMENYPDRKASAVNIIHSSTVSEQYVPYVMPQEHGLKCDVKWLNLSRNDTSLRIESSRKIMFSASHLHPLDLTNAYHTNTLCPRDETILCLDLAHRGLGTGSCGPDTFEHYKIRKKTFQTKLTWQFSDISQSD